MSTTPINPYDPNPFGETQPAPSPALPATRPGGLTAICVIAIVLGTMGFMSGGMKGVNLFFGKQLQELVSGLGGAPNDEVAKAQAEMNAAIWEVSDRFWIPNVLLALAQFILAIALILGGLKTMKLNPRGRKLLLYACGFLAVFEIAQVGVTALVQIEMMPIMEVYMPRMMEAAPGNTPGGEEAAQMIAKLSLITGFVMTAGWMLVKLVFLGIAVWYLCRQRTLLLFRGSASSDHASPAST